MRLSIFAMPAQNGASAQNPAPDGRKLRSRLGLEDSGFDVADMDPGRDLAEQVEALLASRGVMARDEVMFYAGCQALLSVEGELFLCLDPRAPLVGDAVADVASVLRDFVPGPKLVVLDLVDTKATIDPARVAAFVRAAERALDPSSSGIELVLAVRPRSEAEGSPFVEAVLGEVDALPKGRGLTTRGVFERVARKLAEVIPCLHHARTKIAFELVPLRVGKRDSSARMPAMPPPAPVPALASALPVAEQTTTPPSPAVADRKPVAVTSYRPPPSDTVDLGWGGEDDFALAAPPAAPLRSLAAPPGASLPPPPPHVGPPTTFGTDGPNSAPRSGPISGRGISPFGRYTVEGELCISQGDKDGAIASFRKALSVLGPAGDPESRAEMYARIGEIRASKGDNDDAISDFEKALALRPGHMTALESLISLCSTEKDWRGVMSAEERLLSALPSDTMRFERLIEFAARWEGVAEKPQRARVLFERAKELRPQDPIVQNQIRRLLNKTMPPPKA